MRKNGNKDEAPAKEAMPAQEAAPEAVQTATQADGQVAEATQATEAAGVVEPEEAGQANGAEGADVAEVTAIIGQLEAELEAERATPAFAKRKQQDAVRREKAQTEYVEDFHAAVVAYLAFHPTHAEMANQLARLVTTHATPVGSGTVARTKRIPIQQRAEAAVIAWMRHQTTAYDTMAIPRVKGKRREVRRMLAQRSKELLQRYRRGEPVSEACPLQQALARGLAGRDGASRV